MMSDTMTSDRSEWTIERRQPGWLGRLVSPGGSGGAATNTAVLVTMLGAAAFVASMALDWVSVNLPANFGNDGMPLSGRSFGQSLVNSASLGQVYALTGIALLGFAGSLITRPELALRMRLGVTGLGIGMLSIVAAGTLTLRERTLETFGYPIFYGPDMSGITTALEGGLFAAWAAPVLLVVGVWIASRPAARAARGVSSIAAEERPQSRVEAPERVDDPDLADLSRLPPSGRAGSVGGLSVSASEPLDLSVSPDAWRA